MTPDPDELFKNHAVKLMRAIKAGDADALEAFKQSLKKQDRTAGSLLIVAGLLLPVMYLTTGKHSFDFPDPDHPAVKAWIEHHKKKPKPRRTT